MIVFLEFLGDFFGNFFGDFFGWSGWEVGKNWVRIGEGLRIWLGLGCDVGGNGLVLIRLVGI